MSIHALVRPAVRATALLATLALAACASHRTPHPAAEHAFPSDAAPPAAEPGVAVNTEGKSIGAVFEGRFPGVTVSRTDNGGLRFKIRGGGTSFYGEDTPLVLVDDVPAPGSGGIVFLNPNDIARVEVLKNPADVAVYGLRGANGVIRITTKRGR